jgi:O-antigen/teichoic acid export membrane protein
MSALASAVLIGICCLILQPALRAGLGHLITDPTLLEAARRLLPWALAALWLGAVAQVFLSALDASQRGDLRVAISVVATAGQLVAAYRLVPVYGVTGLGPVQVAQAGLTLFLAIATLAATLRYPIRKWLVLDRARFLEIVRFGGSLQVSALVQLLFDPVVKVLLTRLGGLSVTGYYEAANRAVMQCRAVVVAAYQMLVPYLAHRLGGGELRPDQVTSAYRSTHAILMVVAIPYFACLAAALPLLLTVWLGRIDGTFVTIGLICVAGWAINTLTVSAYMLYTAMGRLRWTILSHFAIGALNVALGSLFGWLFGGIGVAVGAMVALALGSCVVSIAFQVEYRIPAREFLPPRSTVLIATSLVGAAVLLVAQFHDGAPPQLSTGLVAALAAFGLVCSILAWRHPVLVAAVQRLRAAPA